MGATLRPKYILAGDMDPLTLNSHDTPIEPVMEPLDWLGTWTLRVIGLAV